MAASITQTLEPIFKRDKEILKLTLEWTAHTDGAVAGITTDNGTFCGETITKTLTGRSLKNMITKPTSATTYTATMTMDGEDLFGGTGTLRSTSATESLAPLVGGVPEYRTITGPLTPGITGAGSGGTGTIILEFGKGE